MHFFFEVQISFLFLFFYLVVALVTSVKFFQKHFHVVCRQPGEVVDLQVYDLSEIPHQLKAVFRMFFFSLEHELLVVQSFQLVLESFLDVYAESKLHVLLVTPAEEHFLGLELGLHQMLWRIF